MAKYSATCCWVLAIFASFALSSESGIQGLSRNPDDVKFYYLTPTNESVEVFWNDEQSLNAVGFRRGVRTILLIDGCDSPQTPYYDLFTEVIRNQSNEAEPNVISVDYSKLNGRDATASVAALTVYMSTLRNIDIVGERVADFLHLLNEKGQVAMSDFHIISFSVGAHVAGSAGAFSQTKYGKSIGRITGLSPSRTFYPLVLVHRLRTGYADFVDNYITNRGVIGEVYDGTGDANVYINGGAVQPGCELEDWSNQPYPGLCSHLYSWEFFAATLNKEKEYLSCPCSGWDCYCRRNCPACETPVKIGMNIPSSTRGNFRIIVNDPVPGEYFQTFKHKILPQYQVKQQG